MNENEFMQKINDILAQDTDQQVRKQSEQYLNEYKQQNPDNFIYAMINLLKNYQLAKNIRSFCAVQLRKNLSVYSEKNFTNLWPKLQADTQNYVKSNLFVCLEQEQENDIRHKIADAIGEIGGTLIEDMQNNQWPELINQIWGLLSNSQNKLIEAGLRVLASIFTFASETFLSYKNELYQIFSNAMTSQDIDIKLGGILALASFLEIIEPKDCKQYEDLIPSLLEQTYYLLTSPQNVDKGEEALSSISDIAEAEPKFWKKNFNMLFEAMYKITFEKQIEDHGIKRIATEVIICVAERLPAVFKKNQANLSRLIEMVFSHMVDIEQEVDPDWEKPIEGFNEDVEEDDELEIVRYGTNAIDRLISSIGDKEMLPALSQMVQQMFQQNDWRYKHAAIMALSQVGEYIDEIKEIEPIVNLVCGYSVDPNPKIRFAVCHCIGQIADDMADEFQTNYHAHVIPILLQLLADKVPRVVSHAAAAITNFVESMGQELLKPYLQSILQMNFELLKTSISVVKESCIAAIAATAEASKEDFRQFFPEAAPFLFQMMQQHTTKEYKQLRGQIIECLTLIAHAVGYELFKQFAPTLIQMMLEIQNSNLDAIDPQKTYLLSGWQRLCLVMDQDFVQYLPTIIPSIFTLIRKVFDESSQFNDDDDKAMDINTNQTEESEVAINMLNVIIDEMKGEFLPYAEQATQLLLPLLQFNTNENIRQAAAKCLPKIIAAVKQKDIQSAFNVAKVFLGSLWNAVSTEYSAMLIIDQVHAMKDCVDEIDQSFLTPPEVDELQKKIVQLLMESDKRKQENAEFQNQEDIEDEEKDLINEENDTEEDLHIAIAQFIGTLFKTHQEKCLPMVDVICNQILPKVLSNTVSDKMHQFGLFLIDDLIEYISVELLADKWMAFAEALLKFITDNKSFVRQAAAFGVGILAVKSNQNFSQISQICLSKIYDALKIAQGDEKQKSYFHARDNIVAALGKVIKFQSNNINLKEVIQVWFSYLPLKHDKPEALQQHDLLCEIILTNSSLIIGENGQNIPKIIKIFAEILDTKWSNQEIKLKIIKSLQQFKDNQIVVSHWQDIVSSLDPAQKQKIDNCFKNDTNQQ